MKTSVAFTVLGGDARMRACAAGLDHLGFTVCDLPQTDTNTLATQLQQTDVLVLPIPAFADACISGTQIQTEQLLSAVIPGTRIFAGVVPAHLLERITDYNQDESFQLSGAIATAEAAIAILIQELPITLFGAKCLIIGNGRIGKALGARLSSLGTQVTISARKKADWSAIEAQNLRTDHTGLYHHGFDYDCIINTVPAPVLSAAQLEQVPKTCLLMDLASKPGGLDWQACEALGLKAIHALALPGKTAPITSGLAIRDVILDQLNLH